MRSLNFKVHTQAFRVEYIEPSPPKKKTRRKDKEMKYVTAAVAVSTFTEIHMFKPPQYKTKLLNPLDVAAQGTSDGVLQT